MLYDKNTVLIGGAVIYKDTKGKRSWFVVRQAEDGDWELPKVVVRKAESSVRAVLRLMGEQSGMRTKVLEEAGRASGVASTNGKTITQKYIYYLMNYRADSGDILGFVEYDWFEYARAVKKIGLKREKTALKEAKEVLKKLEKNRMRLRHV